MSLRVPSKATFFKILLLALSFAAVLDFGFIHYPAIAPRDPDVAELVRQARVIGAAWRKFNDDPNFVRPPRADSGGVNESGRALEQWLTGIFKRRTIGSPAGRDLTNKFWSEGSVDLEPYLGVLPTPPVNVVDAAYGYRNWIPVWVEDVGFVAGPRGYASLPEQSTSGFVIRIDLARADVCRAVAQASGQGKGIPHEVTGTSDWAGASNLHAGEFTCVWLDNRKSGQLQPGNAAFLIFRVI
jgi:hypothetical protein